MDHYLIQFFERLRNTKTPDNTIDTYRTALQQFFPNGEVNLTPEHIDKQLSTMKHLSPNSLRTKLSALAKLIKFIHRRELLPHYDELIDICNSVKLEEKVMDTINNNQLEILIETANSIRDKALIKLLATTGLRISELTALNRKDISNNCLVVRSNEQNRTKNRKERIVYIPKCAMVLLTQYMDTFNVNDALFVSTIGERVSDNAVQKLLERLGKKVGFKITPHTLRRYYATYQLQHGVNIRTLQLNMGHSSPTQTLKYVGNSPQEKAKSAEVFDMEEN